MTCEHLISCVRSWSLFLLFFIDMYLSIIYSRFILNSFHLLILYFSLRYSGSLSLSILYKAYKWTSRLWIFWFTIFLYLVYLDELAFWIFLERWSFVDTEIFGKDRRIALLLRLSSFYRAISLSFFIFSKRGKCLCCRFDNFSFGKFIID
jgi:hypothetical protein